MPSSDPRLISPIMYEVLCKRPRSILDVGMGTGKWGALSREYLDIWWRISQTFDGLLHGTAIVDGIEVFPQYETLLWQAYNTVIVGDACELMPRMPWHDMIICVEVLEHIEREAGILLIKQMLARCSSLILTYTNGDQEAAWGNVHEKHVSRWCEADLAALCPSMRKLVSINRITEAFCMESGSRSVRIDAAEREDD